MDLVKIALGIAAAVGAAFGFVVGNQLTRVEEASSHRDARRLASSSAGNSACPIHPGRTRARARVQTRFRWSDSGLPHPEVDQRGK